MVSGVCGGLADMFNIDPTLVRLITAALIIFSGFTFLLVYIVCAVIIPLEPSSGYILKRHQRPTEPFDAQNRQQSTASTEAPVKEVVPVVEEKTVDQDEAQDIINTDIESEQDDVPETNTDTGNDESVKF